MLVFNGVSPDDILYTNCDDEVCRVPEGREVYDYLREFFVESYSTQKIFVLFVTSENTKVRSEEHTSELQSLMRISYAVFCLKKKKKQSKRTKHETKQNTPRYMKNCKYNTQN